MEDTYLYHQIAESIRKEILEGRLKAGDRLPSVRELTGRWNCTLGTAQHAYRELGKQGLIISQAGRGTQVSQLSAESQSQLPVRRASLVNRAEGFLLEMLTAGYSLAEVQRAVDLAVDRWRSFEETPLPVMENILRLGGSHDLALAWLASHSGEVLPGIDLQVNFSGSLGGLIALAEGKVDLAGCHLWDEETHSYNRPFVQRLFPGRPVALVRLAVRSLGLILPPGNPMKIAGLPDLAREGVYFANRQPGSGTRVWLDARLEELGVDARRIRGYEHGYLTHSEVARAVAEGTATLGLGLEEAARSFGLDFLFLSWENFDLACLRCDLDKAPIRTVVDWLASAAGRARLAQFAGYDTRSAGAIEWV